MASCWLLVLWHVCVRSHCTQCPLAVSYCCYFPLVRKNAASLVLSSSVETHQVMRLCLYSFLSRLLCLVDHSFPQSLQDDSHKIIRVAYPQCNERKQFQS